VPNLLRSRLAYIGCCLLVVATSGAQAQSKRWPAVHPSNGWYSNVFETAVDSRFALLTEVSVRRMGLIEDPKQLFAIAGLGLRVLPGVRLTAGGGYTSSTPCGKLPAPAPSREYSVWYQLQLAQRAGTIDLSHRYRLENR
jgi:hypothetical protein